MADQERLVRFKLLGQDFTFYTGTSEEEMERILDLVRKMFEENAAGVSGALPASKIAVMACLNLASKYMKLQHEFDMYKAETEKRLHGINEQLENMSC